MKEMIKEALDYANKENTWVTNVRDYREIEELLEGAVERIEQLENVVNIAHELVYKINVAVSEDRLPNIFYGLRREFVEAMSALGKE